MKVLVVLLMVLIISNEKVIPFNIIFGKPAERGEFPWVVGITSSDTGLFCSGALISAKHVLTTCRCMSSFGQQSIYKVRLGSIKLKPPYENDSLVVITDKVFMDYKCRFGEVVNDIALIDLKENVPLSGYINWIPLHHTIVRSKVSVTLSGWKKRSDIYYKEYLQFFNLTTIANNVCQIPGQHIDKTVLCCAPSAPKFQNECDIDYGTPLVKQDAKGNYVLVGLLSIRTRTCQLDFPTAYIRISSYRKWIRYHMES